MSALCRFCCKSRRRGWRGSAKPFLKEVPCIPIPACSGRSGGGDARRLEIAHSRSTLWSLQHSRNGGGWHDRRRPGDQLYEPAEVLCDRCQRELELGPARPFPLIWASQVAVMPFVEQGKVKMLAVSTQQRDRMLPQVPTVCESGVPGFDTANWFGVVAPARAPSEVVARVSQAVREATEVPD